MGWNKAIEFFSIPKLYQSASLGDAKLLKQEIVDVGERWLKSKDKPPLYLSGGTGTGKTYFSYALLRGLVQQGHPWIIFISSMQLDSEFLKAVEEGQEALKIQKYKEVPFLFIDDLGTERMSDRIIRQYLQVIDHRHANMMSTVYSSNLTIDQLGNVLGDRIGSRISLSYQVSFPRKDLRKEVQLPNI